MKDFYRILDVPKDADQAAIKKAFKALARKYHPDINKEPGAEERFKEVSAAYEVLGDEQRRALYDEFGEESLRSGFDADRARAWKNMGGAARGGPDPGFGGGIRFEDLFGGFGGFGGADTIGPRKGADIEGRVTIGLLDAVRGAKVDVRFTRPGSCPTCLGEGGTGRKACPACAGKGRRATRQFGRNVMVRCDECGGEGSVYERECDSCAGTGRVRTAQTLSVSIPVGVTSGQVIRLRGKGGEGQHGGPDGDVLLTVDVEPHALLKRNGDDLELEVPITLAEAIGGAAIEVPTPAGGRLRVKVPAGTANGQKLRIPGKGVSGRKGPGDLYLILRPVLPKTTEAAAVDLARQLDGMGVPDVRSAMEL